MAENRENRYQKSIDMLNDAIGKEIASSLQYMYFHVHFEDAGYKYLANQMRRISIAEMRHIEEFAERIMYLEGDVDMDPSFKTKKITSPTEALQFAMELERSTIDLYSRAALSAMEDLDPVTQTMFQSVIAEEEEHHDLFRTELQNLIDYGEADYLAKQSIATTKETGAKDE